MAATASSLMLSFSSGLFFGIADFLFLLLTAPVVQGVNLVEALDEPFIVACPFLLILHVNARSEASSEQEVVFHAVAVDGVRVIRCVLGVVPTEIEDVSEFLARLQQSFLLLVETQVLHLQSLQFLVLALNAYTLSSAGVAGGRQTSLLFILTLLGIVVITIGTTPAAGTTPASTLFFLFVSLLSQKILHSEMRIFVSDVLCLAFALFISSLLLFHLLTLQFIAFFF